MGFTTNQWAILALVLVLGWLLGLLSSSRGGRWRRRYEEERAAHARLRGEHDAYVATTSTRIADLERREPAVGAAAVASTTAGRQDDLSLIRGIGPTEEVRLNEAGIRSYRDIAALSTDQEAALEAKLGYEPGRIARERWREQAELLADGRTSIAPTAR